MGMKRNGSARFWRKRKKPRTPGSNFAGDNLKVKSIEDSNM